MKAIAVVLSLMTVLAFGALSAYADNPLNPNSAVVITDIGCGILGPNGEFLSTTDTHAVITNSKNGNIKLTCHGKLPDGVTPPSKTVHWDYSSAGIPCGTIIGSTTDWKEVVTPSGNVKLTCHYKNP